MSIEVLHAGHDQASPGGDQGHGHARPEGADGDHGLAAGLLAGGSTPLWWSAWQRLACATLLVALLWLVIAWAVT